MSEQGDDRPDDEGPLSVPDEALPEDLRPGEDNPLAEPSGDDVPDDLLKDTSGGGTSSTSSDEEPDDEPDAEPDDQA